MSNPKRVHVYISGHVQGVGFRAMTEAMARNAGVSGWVRNLGDGRVEAVFEGSTAAVESMVRWSRQGSPPAKVISLELQEEPPEGLRGFITRPTLR